MYKPLIKELEGNMTLPSLSKLRRLKSSNKTQNDNLIQVNFGKTSLEKRNEATRLSEKKVDLEQDAVMLDYAKLTSYLLNSDADAWMTFPITGEDGMCYSYIDLNSINKKNFTIKGKAVSDYTTASSIQDHARIEADIEYQYDFEFTTSKKDPNKLKLEIKRIKNHKNNKSQTVNMPSIELLGSEDKEKENLTDLLIEILADMLPDGGGGDGETLDNDNGESLPATKKDNVLIFRKKSEAA